MPKQGGQGKGKPKLGDRDLGRALVKKQLQGFQGLNGNKTERVDMRSILDNSALDDFIITADMENEDAEVRRVHQNDSFLVDSNSSKTAQTLSVDEFSFQHLVIPRKPAWNREMTSEEVDYNEKKSFLQWRRNIAALECNNSGSVKVTPFEKNLDVWRQLWRVVERSDIVIQIVDGRNPLLYFTNDLMKYAAEHNPPKQMILIVNKGDFLTDKQRLMWAEYFDTVRIKYIFYSAKVEQNKLDQCLIPVNNTEINMSTFVESLLSNEAGDKSDSFLCRGKVFTREELLLFLQEFSDRLGVVPQKKNKGKICIGMVGYPNVGKSSVINTLLGVSKSSHGVVRVGVSSTPGKTKHFQTLDLTQSLMLCDCPGLVFPSFMNNTGEMICAGILPINQMRDYIEPASVIAARVPCHLLEAVYGMRIIRELDLNDDPDRPPTAHEVLCSYCAVKGFVTNGTGRWDEFRACKDLLRDLNDGKILFVAPPPTLTNDPLTSLKVWIGETENMMGGRKEVADRMAMAEKTDGFGEMISEDLKSFEPSTGEIKRDHKRLKHWGKKNKKLRDKDPYGENHGPSSFVLYSTNRVS